MNAATVSLRRDGKVLRVEGALLRGEVPRLWRALPAATDGARRIDLGGLDRIDSAGLAMLSLIAATHPQMTIVGQPEGLAELRAAYRLNESLGFSP
ncbi:MAG: STAS domain-containing protein [Lysobacteraceae bacterium]|nr:MAG: STAS domain-containing protein [Xanthomonadaceae bacterium]